VASQKSAGNHSRYGTTARTTAIGGAISGAPDARFLDQPADDLAQRAVHSAWS